VTTPPQPSPAVPPRHQALGRVHVPDVVASSDRGRLRACLVIVLTLAVAGAGCGVAWAVAAPDIELIMTQLGPFPGSELDAGRIVAMDSWYAVLGSVTGLVVGAVLATRPDLVWGARDLALGRAPAHSVHEGVAS
jgi:hypothetical protein